MRVLTPLLLAALAVLGLAEPAFAYVGPGAGLSMLGAFWGLLVAIVAAFSFLLLWPVRRMFRRGPAASETEDGDNAMKAQDEAVQR
jgi:membrane protein implicated in regulation of membrane protease activity